MGAFLSFHKSAPSSSRKRKQCQSSIDDNPSPLKGEGSDITVSALGRDWALHRIYIKQSPFFAAMLEGGWKESESNRIILELSDENITHEALHVVFGSFYLDSVTLSDQTVLSILAAATWFHLEDIRRLCSDFLRRTVRLDTLIDLYTIAGKYNLPELSQTCVNWLSQKLLVLPDTPVFFSLLKRIPIPLMHSVVRHPKLVVIQLEQDVFICLLKWLYLQHHPDKEYCPAAQLLKEAYQYYTTTEAGFLESPDGAAYAAVFRGVRWEHVVSIYKATQRIVQDRIVPRVWLLEAFQRQWMQLLLSHEAQCSTSSTHHHHHHAGTLRSTAANATFLAAYLSPRLNGDAARHQQTSASSDGRELPGPPSDLPDSLFWRHSERFGRWMSSGEHTCSWRWTGYHFGVDILIKYRRRAFHVIRLTDAASAEGSVCRAREHRLKISMSVLSAPSEETATPTADAAANSDASATDSSASEDASSVGCLGDDWEVCGWPGGSRVCFSGLKTFDMLENASYEVVRLPDDFAFPAVVSANILRYDPVQMLSGLVDDDAGAPAL
uniref:BTB domain-containing protein n=2 Tax=Mesocestoides corti TaxID=53468 RepID=A0A5K3F120_MESCO